jgi:hypothetical protein
VTNHLQPSWIVTSQSGNSRVSLTVGGANLITTVTTLVVWARNRLCSRSGEQRSLDHGVES